MIQDIKAHKEKLEQIMADMNCPTDFECYKSGFDTLCKAKNNTLDGYADCLEDVNVCCDNFRVPFGNGAFCRCPLRVYIAGNMENKEFG